MSNKIILKKSAVVGKIPLPADLVYGELAINYADGKLYYKNTNNQVQPVSGMGMETGVANLLHTKFYDNAVTLGSTTLEPQAIDSISTNNFESAEYTIQVTHPTFGKQISKLNVMYDSSVADSVEFGIVFTQIKLCEFTIFYSGSTIQVLADPYVENLSVKYFRTTLI